MQYLRVKNWHEFQHYGKRNPPWIKLHNEILHSRTWVTLDDASKALVIAIMLLASRFNNEIPADPAYIQRVAYLQTLPDLEKLFAADFIERININTEKERETEHASKTLASASTAIAVIEELPEWIDRSLWAEFEQHRREIRAKLTPTATARLIANLDKHRALGADPNEALRQSIENQWRGVFPERLPEKPHGRHTRESSDERRAREADEHRRRILAG